MIKHILLTVVLPCGLPYNYLYQLYHILEHGFHPEMKKIILSHFILLL